MNLIFIYGTLKTGFPNHNEMLKGERLLGVYTTVEKYPLVLTRPWYSPVMFPEPGIGHYVSGEIFDVNDEKLQDLDKFEYVYLPKGFRRHEIKVVSYTGEILTAEAYLRSRKNIKQICSDHLQCYEDDGYIHERQRYITELPLSIQSGHPVFRA